jgi:molybdate transport system substrate-binding protein
MPRTVHLVCLLLVAGAAAALSGCSSQSNEIVVLCGGSFQPPMEKVAKLFEEQTGIHVVLVPGQSEDHLPKIKEHALGDVFVSHDPYVQYTEEAGALQGYVTVGYLMPALVVKKGSRLGIKSIEDLARAKPTIRVALMNPEYATCGKMTVALLEKKGIKDAVLKNVGNAVFREHSAIATQIKLNHCDAGIMWNGMAHNWLSDIEIVPTPDEYDEEIRVAVMGLSYSKKKDLVEKFLDFCQTRGKKVFSEFGYTKSAQPEAEGADPEPDDAAGEGEKIEATGPLLLFCGAGIRPPVAEVAELFEQEHDVTVQCDYAGSEVLLSRIKLTQGDLFMPGDMHYVDVAEQEGLITSKRTVCYFVPVILVQKGNPRNIRSLRDLLRPGIEIGLGDPEACAIGRVTAEILAKNKISAEDIDRSVKARSLTVHELGNYIKLKSLDAVIVWDAVAAYYPDSAEAVPIPREQNVTATVAVAVLKSSEQPELAAKLAGFFASRRSKAVFAKHNYTITPPRGG